MRPRYHLGSGQAPPTPPTLTYGVNEAARCTFTLILLQIAPHKHCRWLRLERSESLSSCFILEWETHFEPRSLLLATDRSPSTYWVTATQLAGRLCALTSRWNVGHHKRFGIYIIIHIFVFRPSASESRLPNEQLFTK